MNWLHCVLVAGLAATALTGCAATTDETDTGSTATTSATETAIADTVDADGTATPVPSPDTSDDGDERLATGSTVDTSVCDDSYSGPPGGLPQLPAGEQLLLPAMDRPCFTIPVGDRFAFPQPADVDLRYTLVRDGGVPMLRFQNAASPWQEDVIRGDAPGGSYAEAFIVIAGQLGGPGSATGPLDATGATLDDAVAWTEENWLAGIEYGGQHDRSWDADPDDDVFETQPISTARVDPSLAANDTLPLATSDGDTFAVLVDRGKHVTFRAYMAKFGADHWIVGFLLSGPGAGADTSLQRQLNVVGHLAH